MQNLNEEQLFKQQKEKTLQPMTNWIKYYCENFVNWF